MQFATFGNNFAQTFISCETAPERVKKHFSKGSKLWKKGPSIDGGAKGKRALKAKENKYHWPDDVWSRVELKLIENFLLRNWTSHHSSAFHCYILHHFSQHFHLTVCNFWPTDKLNLFFRPTNGCVMVSALSRSAAIACSAYSVNTLIP